MDPIDITLPAPPAAAGAADAAPEFTKRDKVLALAGTLAALLMAGLDQTIVATAGPEIQRDLNIPAGLYAWITTAYLVASTVMLPIYGKLSDLYGRKPILLTGVGLFMFGSLLCGLAPSTEFLITARVIQGLGSASLFTTALAVIADLFPPSERGKYMGLIGAVMGISSLAGPIAGGIITDMLGWNWVFFINLPVGLIASWMIITHMPRLGGRGGQKIQVDYLGALWLVSATVPFMVALSLGSTGAVGGWSSWPIVAMFALSMVSIVAFLRVERSAPEPILDLRLFSSNKVIARTTMTMFIMGATFLFTVIFLPLFLVNVLGISATRAGLSLTPLTLGMVLTSILSGQIASRVGHVKAILVAGLVVLLGAFLLIQQTLSADSSASDITLMLVLIGLGMGPTMPLYTLLVQNAAEPHQVGVVTSGSIFARSVGQVIGLALFGTIFAASLGTSLNIRTEAALTPLSPGARALVESALPSVERSGESTSVHFDGAGARQRIAEAPSVTAVDRASALAAVDAVERGFADSLSGAIAVLYRIGAGLVLVGLLLTLSIPGGVQIRARSPRA